MKMRALYIAMRRVALCIVFILTVTAMGVVFVRVKPRSVYRDAAHFWPLRVDGRDVNGGWDCAALGNVAFDGVSAYFSGGKLERTGMGTLSFQDYTITMWLKHNRHPLDVSLFSSWTGVPNMSGVALTREGEAELFVRVSYSDYYKLIDISPFEGTGSFYHIAFASTGDMYVNGIKRAITVAVGSIRPFTVYNLVQIGSYSYNPDYHYTGYMRNLAFWDKLLTDAEIMSLYRRG
jgi:hypothetical protein